MRMQERGFLPDKITWNSLLYGHVQQDYAHETLQLFRQMQSMGIGPDSITFMCVFKACSSLSSLNYAKFLHSLMTGTSISTSAMVKSSLIDMYANCGDLKTAVKVFSCRSFEKDLVSWNTIIAGHLQHGLCRESFHLFEQMVCKGVLLRQVTFVLMLKACSASRYLQEGQVLHSYIMESSFDLDTFVGSALVDLYVKWGNLREVRIVFDRIPRRGLVTWSALVAGYAWHGNASEALLLIQQMEEDGVKPSVVTWNGLIRGCAYNGLCAEAFNNFNQMLIDHVEPNEATFVSVLSACLDLDELKQGKVVHASLIEGGWESGWSTGCALINMYANAHCLKDSLCIFDILVKQEVRVWSTMIEAFVQQQHFQEAIQLSQRMQQEGLFLNQVVMASILKACMGAKTLFQCKIVHVQALELGFESDKLVGHSLMNIYAKYGGLNDAWSVFYKICNRDEVTWSAMLEACADRNDHKLALLCFQGMQAENLDPNEVSFLSLLSVCSHTGLTEEACCYFSAMSDTYGLVPSFTHYTCVADVFGRTGCVVEADDLLHSMPFEPNSIGYLSVLNHCKTHGNYYVGEDYFDRTHDMTCQHSAYDSFQKSMPRMVAGKG
ncbi:hypothetical protein GOP47_0021121 [Adiantum capillus-veneris]|uniref:Pentatricopeptide repeat-containing protein n=1 Tax=Adiantum capillus-veneris TaxID=13818 RepID=A0A9D4Z9C8_ADICA|nr:hypothetical protein GOP47_0021121 [Adiantum capillus-veneris]